MHSKRASGIGRRCVFWGPDMLESMDTEVGHWGQGQNNGARALLSPCEIRNKRLVPVKRKRLPYRKITTRAACVYFGPHPINGHTATPPRHWLSPFPSLYTMAITSVPFSLALSVAPKMNLRQLKCFRQQNFWSNPQKGGWSRNRTGWSAEQCGLW